MCILKRPCDASLVLQNISPKVGGPSGGLIESWEMLMNCGNKADEDQGLISCGCEEDQYIVVTSSHPRSNFACLYVAGKQGFKRNSVVSFMLVTELQGWCQYLVCTDPFLSAAFCLLQTVGMT